jgi:very-short-patch-repair endonuclease
MAVVRFDSEWFKRYSGHIYDLCNSALKMKGNDIHKIRETLEEIRDINSNFYDEAITAEWVEIISTDTITKMKMLPEDASPIERQFWISYIGLQPKELNGLIPQCEAGRYRIDFAIPDRKFGIELDGHASHSSTAAIARDRKRQRDLEMAGWRIIRFGGSEVYHDAAECVRQAAEMAG